MPAMEVYKLVATGQLKKFPHNYLEKESIKEIVRNVFLNELKLTREDVLKIKQEDMTSRYMGGFRKFFDMQNALVMIYSFPEWDLKPWEFTKVHPKFWEDTNNQREFVLWIAKKEGLDITCKEDLRKITVQMIWKYRGSKALVAAGGTYGLLKTVCGDKYKEWEITKVVSWTDEKVVEAVKWLLEEKLKITSKESCKIRVTHFKKYNLDGMLQKACNHSIIRALNMAYPGRYTRKDARNIVLK